MKTRGSVTVFLALCIGIFLAGVFAFLEAARVSCLKANARMSTLQASDSLLAEYHPDLWKDYHVLFWESGESSGISALESACIRQRQFISGNYDRERKIAGEKDDFYLLKVALPEVKVDSYELSTDYGGAPFRKQAAIAVSDFVTESAADKMRNLAQGALSGSSATGSMQAAEESAQSAMHTLEEDLRRSEAELESSRSSDSRKDSEKTKEELEAEKAAQEALEKSVREKRKALEGNPITWMAASKRKGILGAVLPGKAVSSAEIETGNLLSHRTARKGNFESCTTTAAENMRFYYYLQKKFSCYTSEKKDGALEYEQEYILAGKNSDTANLKAVVRRLLLMREGMNYLYLQKDQAKNSQAFAMAAAIAAVFAQPQLVQPIKQGILAAWAYAESVSDLRILLDGGKVSLVKTAAQWHTSLENLSGSGSSSGRESNKSGLTYKQYLLILFFEESIQKVTYRAMDLMEVHENLQMDRMVSQMRCSYRYQANPIFWDYVTLGNHTPHMFEFREKELLSYLKKEQRQ